MSATDRGELRTMTEEKARSHAETLALAMGITFYVVRSREGQFQPVQIPPQDGDVVATVDPPSSGQAQTF
jgi:hypothetical protein